MLNRIGTLSAAIVCLALPAHAQQGARDGEWRSYAGDPGSTKYSALDQINKDNVKQLRVAWRWKSIDYELSAKNPELKFNNTLLVTPLMVGGRLFMSSNLGLAAAVDATTGRTIW